MAVLETADLLKGFADKSRSLGGFIHPQLESCSFPVLAVEEGIYSQNMRKKHHTCLHPCWVPLSKFWMLHWSTREQWPYQLYRTQGWRGKSTVLLLFRFQLAGVVINCLVAIGLSVLCSWGVCSLILEPKPNLSAIYLLKVTWFQFIWLQSFDLFSDRFWRWLPISLWADRVRVADGLGLSFNIMCLCNSSTWKFVCV